MLSLIQAVAGRPWAIRTEIAMHMRGLIAKEGLAGLRHLAALKADVHAFDEGPRAAARPPALGGAGMVAVVPVVGTLTQRAQLVGSAETRSTAQVAAEVRAAAMDSSVDAVLLEIDSPGGEVFGVPEAWASIRESGRMKPVVAHANSVAASAALYLASAANEFWITPSGEAGSVGVYALHVDASKALEAAGESWDFIVATKSPYKIEGNPAAPLTDEARAYLQAEIDRYMGMFIRDLAKGRRVSEKQVENGFGGGRMLSPSAATAVGMADGVATFEQVVRRAAELGRERRGGPRAEALIRPAADQAELAAIARLAGIELEP
jgi:signal peptide peptidase SppA